MLKWVTPLFVPLPRESRQTFRIALKTKEVFLWAGNEGWQKLKAAGSPDVFELSQVVTKTAQLAAELRPLVEFAVEDD